LPWKKIKSFKKTNLVADSWLLVAGGFLTRNQKPATSNNRNYEE
jgi:hypothetical protein